MTLLPPPLGSALVTMLAAALLGSSGPGSAQPRPAQPGPEGSWPLRPTPAVVQRFAPPEQRWQPGHRGVDLAGRTGQSVHAAVPGRVTFAGRVAGKPVVVVTHGPTRTTYEPVVPVVRAGEDVAAGDRLGVLTLPFSHCYPDACLHWGLRRGETYLDPLVLVGASAPIRLLPLTPGGGPGGRRFAAGPW